MSKDKYEYLPPHQPPELPPQFGTGRSQKKKKKMTPEEKLIFREINNLIDKLEYGGVTFARVIEELPKYTIKQLQEVVFSYLDYYRRYHTPKLIDNERGCEWVKKSNYELYIQKSG